ncbi:AAA family ATPase [Rhizobium leguminosarum bv. viciae]|uniref:ATP-binding protein n=1 Tax=Rhizobium leguminosarum TaxID=384 RepID=UPI0014415441|nr:ATP-binding protein [Rhizobium leguminosarum]NKL08395.1 AAA family ATPase [Rhizobium leguminosarum bv. viciae]
MSNTDRGQELLKELRKDKIEVITETGEYRHFKLNGVEYLEFIEGGYTLAMFDDAISATLGYGAQDHRNIYRLTFLATYEKKLFERMKRVQNRVESHSSYKDTMGVITLLRAAGKLVEEERQKRFDDGVTTYDDLPFLFAEDDRVTWLNPDEIQVGGYYKGADAKRSWTGGFMQFNVEVVVKISESISRAMISATVPEFAGTVEIAKLPITKLVAGSRIERELLERGQLFATVAAGHAYVDYSGAIVKPSWWSDTVIRADGRVMIDPASMGRIDSEGYKNAKKRVMQQKGYRDDDESEVKIETVDEKDLFACSPYVLGFSFRAKTWGMMRVSGLKPIDWAKDAFERLVLEPKTKKRVRGLVQSSGDSFSDIIGGKGGGCVFLLHGEPGQGKTLTAETVAEDLKRPLYSISVGELGTDPDQLEKRLREILDLATVWNAVLLLDEADIFLEARDEKDVLRNAMVGVFLRLLEYHQGVLFLTTNRVRNIDRAFYSRISVAIAFTKADLGKRVKVWTNLLKAAGLTITTEDIAKLADADLNGRQVKNVIRTASTMAKLDGEAVTYERLVEEIEEATRFEREMLQAPDYLSKPKLKAVA